MKNEIVSNTDQFAQPNGTSRTMLAKAIAFVIAGQLSRGKQIREQCIITKE